MYDCLVLNDFQDRKAWPSVLCAQGGGSLCASLMMMCLGCWLPVCSLMIMCLGCGWPVCSLMMMCLGCWLPVCSLMIMCLGCGWPVCSLMVMCLGCWLLVCSLVVMCLGCRSPVCNFDGHASLLPGRCLQPQGNALLTGVQQSVGGAVLSVLTGAADLQECCSMGTLRPMV